MANDIGIDGGSVTLFVADMARAKDFYVAKMGLSVLYDAGEHFCMIDAGPGLKIGLHPSGSDSPEPGSMGCTQIGFAVNKPIENVMADLKSRGVEFTCDEATDDGYVKIAYFRDPDGTSLHLCEVK